MLRDKFLGGWKIQAVGLLLGLAFSLDGIAATTTVTVGNATATVNGPNGTVLNFPVTRSGDLSYDAYVGYQAVDGTAVAGQNYTVPPGTLKLPAGVSTVNLPVTILGSSTQYPDKSFTIQLIGAGTRGQSVTTNASQTTYDLSVTTGAFAVIAADVNGDGLPDLLSTNSSSNTVSIWRNTTARGAAAPSYILTRAFNVGSSPNGLTVADLNDDGKLDVIVANKADNTISVLVNTGSSFAAQQVFAAGSSPVTVVAADINNDGRLDLIIGDMIGGTFTVLMNVTPPGATTVSFAAPQTFNAGTGVTGYAVVATDVNQDGLPDVIVASNANVIRVLLNTTPHGSATASFTTAQSFTVGNGAGSVRVVDINGDGKPDLVTANFTDSTISVLLNNTVPGATTASYAPQQAFSNAFGTSTAFQSYDVGVGDIDGDGIPDLIVTQSKSSVTTGVWIGGWINKTVPGSMTATLVVSALDLNGSSHPTSPVISIAAVDANLDGTFDVITLNQSKLSVLLTAGVTGGSIASFGSAQNLTAGSDPIEVTVADLNADGKPDLVTANNAAKNVSVLLNTTPTGATSASYTAQQTFAVGRVPTSVAAWDLNGDGKPDLAVVNSTDDTISILRNTTAQGATTSSFAAQQVTTKFGSTPSFVMTLDWNRNGIANLESYDEHSAFVFANTTTSGSGTITFSNSSNQLPGAGTSLISPVAADINGDALPDLVVLDWTTGSVSVLVSIPASPHLGPHIIGEVVSGSAPWSPKALAVADLNGDGKPDLIVVSEDTLYSIDVTVWFNTTINGNSTVTFTAPQTISLPVQYSQTTLPTSMVVTAADIDGDGRPDLVIGDSGDAKLTVLMNAIIPQSSSAAFVPAGTILTNESAISDIKFLDVNGDGKTDIVVGSNSSSFIDVVLNTTNTLGQVTSYTATGTIHYNVVPLVISIANPSASILNSIHQTLAGSVSTAAHFSINGINVPLNADNTFSDPVTLLEPPSTNTLIFAAVDLNGNAVSVTKAITVDDVPPKTPNTGLIRITYIAGGMVSVVGTATSVDPNTAITIADQTSGLTVTVTSDATGAFNANLVAHGGDQITITATDEVDNTSEAGISVPIDTTPPTITVTSPLYTKNPSYTLSGNLSEGGYVEVNGGSPITTGNNYSFGQTVPLNTETNIITIAAQDFAGNSAAPQTVNVVLDQATPVITVSNQIYTNQLTITGSVNEPGTLSEPATLTITCNGVNVGGSTVQTNQSFSAHVTVAQGSYTCAIAAQDMAGNSATPVTINFTYDTTPPLLSVAPVTPANSPTRNLQYTFTGSMNEPGTVSVGGVTAILTPGNLNFSILVDLPAETDNYFVVQGADLAGNPSAPVNEDIVRDTTAPALTITSPLFISQLNLDGSYTFMGSIDDVSGTLQLGSATIPLQSDGTFIYQIPSLNLGPNNFTFTTKDALGNTETWPITVNYDITPPTITVTSPAGTYTNNPNMAVGGSVSEPVTVMNITLNGPDGLLYDNSVVRVNSDLTFSISVPPTGDGVYSYSFTAQDLAGNFSPLPVTGSFTLDTIPPNLDITRISAAGTGPVTIVGQASATEANTALVITALNGGQSVNLTSDSSGAFSTNGTNLTIQAQDPFKIIATDEAGNSAGVRLQYGIGCFTNASTRNTSLTVAAASATVTGPNQTTINFPVTRSGDLGFDAYIDYQTPDDTAYTGGIGTLMIPAGSASAQLPITVAGSSISASDKSFTLQILGTHNVAHKADFSARDIFATGQGPASVVTADVDGDGKSDIVEVNSADNTISIFLNTTPAGTSQETFTAQPVIHVGQGPNSVVAADLNNDGKPDLVVTNKQDGTITVLVNPNDGTANFAALPPLPAGTGPEHVAVADVNQDGKPDLLVVNDDNHVLVYLNTSIAGATSFAAPVSFGVGVGPLYVTTADFNHDGLLDIVTANSGDGTVSVLVNTTTQGNLSFAAQMQYLVGTDASSDPKVVATADINGDGLPDLAIATSASSTVAVMLNTTSPSAGAVTFSAAQHFTVGSGPVSLIAADLDGDTKPDLIVSNKDDNTLSVLINTTPHDGATPTFDTQQVIPAGDSPWPVAVADLNNDGKLDLVEADQDDDKISVLMSVDFEACAMPANVTGTLHYNVNPPAITLTSPTATTFQSPYQTLVGSVSGVNTPITLTLNGTTVPLNSDGTFSQAMTLQPGTNTYTLIATDSSGNAVPLVETYTLNSPSLPSLSGMPIQFSANSGVVTITGQPGTAYTGDIVTVTDVTNGNVAPPGTVGADGSFSVQIQGSLSDEFSIVISTADGQNQSPPVFMHGNDPALGLTISTPTSGAGTANVTGTYSGPLDMGITVNGEPAVLMNGSFYLNNLSLTSGSNTITVTATTLGGLTATQTVSVTGNPSALAVVLSATPEYVGVGTLSATFQYSYTGSTPLQLVEMSYAGEPFNSVASGSQISSFTPTYNYAAPGVYQASIRLTDTNNNQYVDTIYMVVEDPVQLDSMFQGVWSDFTSVLTHQSEAASMNDLDYTGQQNYAPVFDALMSRMPTVISSFSPLLESSLTSTTAEYAIVRNQSGQNNLYFVYFVQGTDGVWRLESM